MSVIAEQLRETAALYLACMEDKDKHCSKILGAARLIDELADALQGMMPEAPRDAINGINPTFEQCELARAALAKVQS